MADDTTGYTLTKTAVQRTAKTVRDHLGDRGTQGTPTNDNSYFPTLVKIMNSTDLGKNQWKYSVQLVHKKDGLKSELADDSTQVDAYNWYEFGNDDSTTVVNGVTLDTQVKGLKPIPNLKIFPAILFVDSTGKLEYWFTSPNEWNVVCNS